MLDFVYMILALAGVIAGAGLLFLLITWRVRTPTGGSRD